MTMSRALAVLTVLSAFACSDQRTTKGQLPARASTDASWTLADAPSPSDSTSGALTVELIESKRYGAEEGDGWLASFESVAANDSIVAIGGGIRNCEVVVFHRTSGRELTRFGRCGGGPQDLQHVSVLAMKSDSIAVVDREGARLQLFSARGEYVRSQRLHEETRPAIVTGMFEVAWLRDSLSVFVVRYGGHDRRAGQIVANDPDSPFVRVHSATSGRRLASAGVEGTAVAQFNYGEEREMSACVVAKGTRDGRPAVVVFNRWAAQVVAYDLDSLIAGRPAIIMNKIVRELPIGAFRSERSSDLMTAHHMQARCGERLALGQYLQFNDPDPSLRLASDAYLVAIAPGTGEHGVLRTKDAPLLGRLLGASGNTFFFGHRARFEFPMVIAATLRTKPVR